MKRLFLYHFRAVLGRGSEPINLVIKGKTDLALSSLTSMRGQPLCK